MLFSLRQLSARLSPDKGMCFQARNNSSRSPSFICILDKVKASMLWHAPILRRASLSGGMRDSCCGTMRNFSSRSSLKVPSHAPTSRARSFRVKSQQSVRRLRLCARRPWMKMSAIGRGKVCISSRIPVSVSHARICSQSRFASSGCNPRSLRQIPVMRKYLQRRLKPSVLSVSVTPRLTRIILSRGGRTSHSIVNSHLQTPVQQRAPLPKTMHTSSGSCFSPPRSSFSWQRASAVRTHFACAWAEWCFDMIVLEWSYNWHSFKAFPGMASICPRNYYFGNTIH